VRSQGPPGAPNEVEGAGLLGELDPFPGIEAAVLVDRSGRLVESRGVEDPARLRQVASLVAAMHAAAARLSEASGDPGRARTTVRAGERILLLDPLPWPSTLVLLLVLTEEGIIGVPPFLGGLVDRLQQDLPSGGVTDAREFEASLERSLQAFLGRSAGSTTSPPGAPSPDPPDPEG
jgi:predicted regulator of Ras-like GTPase activity (Roadblock/LC7/MglB family)